MKAPILALAAAATAFAGSSIYLWSQLREARARGVQSEAVTRELNQRIAELEKAHVGVSGQHTAKSRGFITGQITQDNPAITATPAPAEPDPGMWAQPAPSAAPFERPEAMLKMMRSQMRGHNKRQYGDFCEEELRLDKATTDKLISLLTDHDLKHLDPIEGMSDPEDFQRRIEQMQRENQQEVADLIGPENARELQDYRASLPARLEVEMFAQQLEGNDVPLSNAQVEKLQDAYVEERARVPPPEFSFTGDPTTYIESMGEWQKDYNRRVGDRVATILNAEQLSVYNEIRQWQDQMQGGVQFTSPVVGVTGMPAIGGANVVTFSAAAPAIAVSAPANEKED